MITAVKILAHILKLVKENSNDMDLGKEIRAYVLTLNKEKK